MPNATVVEPETTLDRTMLNEIVHWVRTLKEVGVSPDIAAQVATKFFIAACNTEEEEEETNWDEYSEEDDEE